MKFVILFAAIVTATSGSTGASSAPPDPADAKASVPLVQYQSPLREYRPFGDDKNTAWKDANDTVGKIGGWRAYAREAADAMKAKEAINGRPPTPPPPAAIPATPPAQNHKHGG